jgi:LuxR family quorum-sensing system transcriptional regulator ExpR
MVITVKDSFYNDSNINSLIQHELDEFVQDEGQTIFAYAIMNKKDPSQMRIINNNPQWFELYLERKYQFIDPVIIRALSSVEDFSWDSGMMVSSGYTLPRIFNEGSRHNIIQGHTFPLHDYMNNLVVLSLINHQQTDGELRASRATVFSFFITLHQRMLSLYSDIRQKKNVFLSPREQQILQWVYTGKTYGEIATILTITERTVKFHMGNAMKKLGVNNARHAVKLSMELRLLDI